MGYRGRLIWPFQARIERLDTAATEANAIGGQPSGIDRTFREPVKNSTGEDSRVYMSATAVHCQVVTERGEFGNLIQLPGGRTLQFDMQLALHYAELELEGLIAPHGGCVFQASDRLMSIYKKDAVTLVRDFSAAPLYCVHVQDRSFGLDALERNLVMLYFKDRRKGAP